MKIHNQFWGSTIGLAVGWIAILAFFGGAAKGEPNAFLEMGLALLFGTYAYRSLKRRLLGLKATTRWSVLLEYTSLFIVVWVFLGGLGNGRGVDRPFEYFIFPLWTFIAYVFIAIVGRKNASQLVTIS